MTPGFGDRLLVAPTWEPVSVALVKSHCRIRQSIDDPYIGTVVIPAAREYVETLSRRAIPQQQWELTIDQFPGRQVDDYRPPTWRYGIIRMPRPPLISVESVEYIDPGQATAPFTYTLLATTEYMVDTNTEPGRVAPAPFKVWPATNPLAFQSVRVHFTAGYASAALVPARLIQAILLVCAHLYEHRGEATEVALQKVPMGVRAFITAASPHEYS